MVPLASAGWGAAWVGTEGSQAGFAAAAAGVAVALVVAGLRRSAMLLAVALVTTAIAGAGIIDVYRLRHGPVALLADQQAMISADLEIRTDPHLVAGGMGAGAAVMRAATVRIAGRGQDWLVRTRVLVVVTGPQLAQWLHVPVGTRVAADGFASWSGYEPDCDEQLPIADRSRVGWCLLWCWATPPVWRRI